MTGINQKMSHDSSKYNVGNFNIAGHDQFLFGLFHYVLMK